MAETIIGLWGRATLRPYIASPDPPAGSVAPGRAVWRTVQRMRRFRLTIYFVLTAFVVLTAITFGATHIGSGIAAENLTVFK